MPNGFVLLPLLSLIFGGSDWNPNPLFQCHKCPRSQDSVVLYMLRNHIWGQVCSELLFNLTTMLFLSLWVWEFDFRFLEELNQLLPLPPSRVPHAAIFGTFWHKLLSSRFASGVWMWIKSNKNKLPELTCMTKTRRTHFENISQNQYSAYFGRINFVYVWVRFTFFLLKKGKK